MHRKSMQSLMNDPLDHPTKPILKTMSDLSKCQSNISRPSTYSESQRPYPDWPSVSTIIKTTMPEEQKSILERWKRKQIALLGQEGFEKMQQDTFNQCTALHLTVENYHRRGGQFEISAADKISKNASSVSVGSLDF